MDGPFAAGSCCCRCSLVMALVTGLPLAATPSGVSFTDASLDRRWLHWVGLENFAKVLANPQFHPALLGHTFYFILISVSIEVVLGVPVALLLDQDFVGRTLLRALLILPWALPTIVNATMWRLIYNPDFGSLQRAADATRPDRLLSLLAGRARQRHERGHPRRRLEELPAGRADRACRPAISPSELEGGGDHRWRRALDAFPRQSPARILGRPLSVAIVLRTIEAFKVFDIIWVMTRGGPADGTKTLELLRLPGILLLPARRQRRRLSRSSSR